ARDEFRNHGYFPGDMAADHHVNAGALRFERDDAKPLEFRRKQEAVEQARKKQMGVLAYTRRRHQVLQTQFRYFLSKRFKQWTVPDTTEMKAVVAPVFEFLHDLQEEVVVFNIDKPA